MLKKMSLFGIMIILLTSCNFINNNSEPKQKLENIKIEESRIIEKENLKPIISQEDETTQNEVDFKSDSSFAKFVSANVGFNDKKYIPSDLVNISSKNIYDAKGGSQVLRKQAKDALLNMANDFYIKFNKPLVVVSAYRSYLDQKKIKDAGCSDVFCAKAGFSEHQTGLAIDFFETTNKKQFLSNPQYKLYFEWLQENAYKYGFHNTYQFGVEIDTYEVEPWHWRYLGVELATELKINNQTYSMYIKNKQSK